MRASRSRSVTRGHRGLAGPALVAIGIGALSPLFLPAMPARAAGPVVPVRSSEPVVLTGSQIPGWARSAPVCVGQPYPSGVGNQSQVPLPAQYQVRTAHNGTCTLPPDGTTGIDPNEVTAFRWDGAWQEVPVQVDQRFDYFLANDRSSFSFYSGTDQELTYAWNPDAHDSGAETWKMVWGDCSERYADPNNLAADIAWAQQYGLYTPGPQETPQDYTHAMPSPSKQLTVDDEVSFMARDAGAQAPSGAAPPSGAHDGRTVTLVDPVTGDISYVYLFVRHGGSSFTWQNGYVSMARDANADEFIDVDSFSADSTEILGKNNRSYGPNLYGDVCVTAPNNIDGVTTASGTPRFSKDRFPRDGMTVTTPTYTLRATGRWMIRGFSVTAPGTTGQYGPSLVSRWKGRAFQSSPDSQVSLVGFEDEQTNWEANSSELGWRVGPVRAIREVWGADSGTNVTKTEYYYRDADVFQYHVRVHPIPPDGLYTSWDYNLGTAARYYNTLNPNGVPIDGVNDNVGYVDQLPVTGTKAYFNSCDPAFDVCSAVDRPEEVAGNGSDGGLVYIFKFDQPQTSALNPAAVPYYRDDACFDDGTGDNPVPRPYPGEDSQSTEVKNGYVAYWQQKTGNTSLTYSDLKCNPSDTNPSDPAYVKTPFQGAIGEHGIHFFATADTDNATQQKPVDELVGEQWRFSVPMSGPQNVLMPYGLNVIAPLQAVVTPFGSSAPTTALLPALPEAPLPFVLPLLGLAIVGWVGLRRRHGRSTAP